jgi:hypothetical protein
LNILIFKLPGGALAAARPTSGCISFATQPIAASQCRCFLAPESTVQLLNTQKSGKVTAGVTADDFDSELYDPAFLDGALIENSQPRLLFQPPAGEYMVEVTVTGLVNSDKQFWLVLDKERIGPWRAVNGKTVTLLAWMSVGRRPVIFAVETDAPRYVLSAVRWTDRDHFGHKDVPRLLARARRQFRQPVYGRGLEGAVARVSQLIELLERVRLANDAAARREAMVGLARARYWLSAENIDTDLEETSQALRRAAAVAPQNALLRQTISAWCRGIPNLATRRSVQEDFCARIKPEPWPVAVPRPAPGAPDWATTQRLLMARLHAITSWWVHNRQQPNGEMGGGLASDIELSRLWIPLALGFGDSDAALGLNRLIEANWKREAAGNDQPHAAAMLISGEAGIDIQPLALVLNPDNEQIRRRLIRSSECIKNWIQPSPSGHWHFLGGSFTCDKFVPDITLGFDLLQNVRAAAPALWRAYLTRDPELIRILSRWGEAWIASMRQTGGGKPPGVFPPAVRFSDGGYLVHSPRWWEPFPDSRLYNWSGASQEAAASLLLALHELTGEKRWLDAAGESFALVAGNPTQRFESLEILANPQAFLEWRQRSGDPRYDNYFHYSVPLPGDQSWLQQMRTEATQLARNIESRHAVNFAMYTSEALFTNRVFYPLPSSYLLRLFGGESPRGDHYPTFAVSFPPPGRDLARAVLLATIQRLEILLYNFERGEIAAEIRLWKLSPGKYQWQVIAPSGNSSPLRSGVLEVTHRGQLFSFPLPPKTEVVLRIEPDAPAPNHPDLTRKSKVEGQKSQSARIRSLTP